MKNTKILKSFYKTKIAALALSICLFTSCNQENKDVLEEEIEVAAIPELTFSKSISLKDEYGNTISLDVSANVQAKLDSYSAESFEFKAMTQEDLLVQEEEGEESLDDDQIEDEDTDTELSTGDPIVFKETNVELNTNDGFIAYQLTMKPEVSDGLEDRRDRTPYYFSSETQFTATVRSRKLARPVYGYWYRYEGSTPTNIVYQQKITRYGSHTAGTGGRGWRLGVTVSAEYRDHFTISFFN